MLPMARAEPGPVTSTHRWWRSHLGAPAGRELLLVAALLAVYKLGRLVVRDETARAIANARDLVQFERTLDIFTEARLQDTAFSAGVSVVQFLNAYYLYAHVVVTAAVCVWLFVFRRAVYVRFRRVMVVMTLTALAVHLLYPLAPPRMVPNLGIVDTGALVGPASYGEASAYQGFANELAAMPSLHFGWALAAAWALVRAFASPLRLMVYVHPALTLATIIMTGHHYWLDAGAATALFALGVGIDALALRRGRLHRGADPGGDRRGVGGSGDDGHVRHDALARGPALDAGGVGEVERRSPEPGGLDDDRDVVLEPRGALPLDVRLHDHHVEVAAEHLGGGPPEE
jgi:hypothetical protein